MKETWSVQSFLWKYLLTYTTTYTRYLVFFFSQALLTHPLCKALLRKKWKNFGRYFYYGIFIGYVIFLAILTTYGISFSKAYRSSISTSENKTEEKETHFQFCNKKQGIFNAYEIFIIVFSVVFLIFEIIQFIRVIIWILLDYHA